jgi:hypothetical protein
MLGRDEVDVVLLRHHRLPSRHALPGEVHRTVLVPQDDRVPVEAHFQSCTLALDNRRIAKAPRTAQFNDTGGSGLELQMQFAFGLDPAGSIVSVVY